MSAPSTTANIFGRGLQRTRTILEMIKFEHTIFMLPFALMAAVVSGRNDWVQFWHKIPWILLAMAGARSAAMAFNRIVDRDVDALNPRTKNRALPAGQLSVIQVSVFTAISSILLIFAAYKLNHLAFLLSPVALAIVFFYSYTKRFTALSHVFLGIATSVAPVGAWVAITGRIDLCVLWLAGAVVCWLTGFDILYALQDTDFDKSIGLHSIPAKLGNAKALIVSRLAHTLMIVLLFATGYYAHLGIIYTFAVCVVAVLIAYEQSLVKPNDISKLNLAFFTLNGYISIALFILTTIDVLLH